jgi:quinol monooxygenase YgiN
MSLIVVVARLQAKPEKRDELVAAAQKAIAATRQEPGCISYAMYQDTASENDFVFVEEWQDIGALRQHTGSDHLAELGQALPDLLAGAADVRVHTIERSQSLAEVANG